MPKEEECCQLGGRLLGSGDEGGVLREPVNDKQDGLKIAHFWEMCNSVHGYALPWSCRKRQGFSKPSNFRFLDRVEGAKNIARNLIIEYCGASGAFLFGVLWN